MAGRQERGPRFQTLNAQPPFHRRCFIAIPGRDRPRTSLFWGSDLRAAAVVLALAIPALGIVSVVTYQQIVAERSHLRSLRVAQVSSFTLLQLQLDEETGLRGYTSTGDRTFLQPYLAASRSFGGLRDQLQSEVDHLQVPRASAAIAAIGQDHREWLETVAQPLLRNRNAPGAAALQMRGKALIDAFRAAIARLHGSLDTALDDANRRTTAAVQRTLALGLLSSCAVLFIGLLFALRAAQASRRAFETSLLYDNEKRIVDLLQTAFVQESLPTPQGVRFDAIYVPAGEEAQVGGDWYDAFELGDGQLFFSIGDVAGHGLEAAVLMSRARQAIIAAAVHEHDPGAVLSRANNTIRLQGTRMVTAICGYVLPGAFEVVYATAGHPAPILVRANGAAEFLPYGGVALGLVTEASYRRYEVNAGMGGFIVFYTDGVIEQGRDLDAGEARLLDAARVASAQARPALSIQRATFGEEAPTDDVAILTVRFTGVPGSLSPPRLMES